MTMLSNGKLKLSKLEAARCQLCTAIELWFAEADPVSTHTLAFAAYEVIHFVSKKRNPGRRDLVFDSRLIRPGYQKIWNEHIRREANFFKHADRDPDGTIEFRIASPEFFILYAILGLELCEERFNDTESAFLLWFYLHKPTFLTEEGEKAFHNGIAAEHFASARQLPKHEFLETFRYVWRLRGGGCFKASGVLRG